jgi:hypothetical protein
MSRKQTTYDYQGYTDDDITAQYNNCEDCPMEVPVGDLLDSDKYWLHGNDWEPEDEEDSE